MQTDISKSHLMNNDIPQTGHGRGPGAEFLNFNPFRKFGTGEARNHKFCTRVDFGNSHLMNDNIPQRGRGQGLGLELIFF